MFYLMYSRTLSWTDSPATRDQIFQICWRRQTCGLHSVSSFQTWSLALGHSSFDDTQFRVRGGGGGERFSLSEQLAQYHSERVDVIFEWVTRNHVQLLRRLSIYTRCSVYAYTYFNVIIIIILKFKMLHEKKKKRTHTKH
jgi:hypothetical protein